MNAFKQRYQSFKQNVTWKKAAMTGIAGGCTLAQIGLAINSISLERHKSYLNHLNNKYEKEFENFKNIHPDTESFIKEHLKKCGVTQQDNLRIKMYDGNWGVSRTDKYLWFFIPESAAKELNNALEVISKARADIREQLNRGLDKRFVESDISYWLSNRPNLTYVEGENWVPIGKSVDAALEAIAIIHHEGGHIINNDPKNFHFAPYAMLGGNLALSFFARKKFITNDFYRKNCAKILSGLIIAKLVPLEYYQYTQFRELKADDNTQNNIYIVKAAKRFHENGLKLHKEHYEKLNRFPAKFVQIHPHPEVRIERFDEKIKAIYEKNDPESFEDPLGFKEAEIK